MAEVRLNTTSSIRDLFKSKGLPDDFSTRQTVFKNLGLEGRIGRYVGSEKQNPAFIKALGGFSDEQIKQSLKGAVTPTSTTTPEAKPITSGDFTTPSGAVIDVATGQLKTPEPLPTATGALAALGVEDFSGEDLAQKALESSKFKLFQEGQGIKSLGIASEAEADKQKLEGEASAETKKTLQSFGQRGLFFSGMRADAVQDIVNNLAASKLGVDRETAQKLLEQGQSTKEKFADIVSDIVKEAKEGRKEALSILEKQGLTIGMDGKTLVPTLSAQREERALRAEERAEISQGISFERLRLSEEAGRRAEAASIRAEQASLRAERRAASSTETRDIGGRLVRITFDEAGNEVGRQDLGQAGSPTQNENEVLFAQYVSQLGANTKTTAELREDALKFGLNPADTSVDGIISNANTTSALRRFLGF